MKRETGIERDVEDHNSAALRDTRLKNSLCRIFINPIRPFKVFSKYFYDKVYRNTFFLIFALTFEIKADQALLLVNGRSGCQSGKNSPKGY
jgi:hypothetical protein